MEATAFSSSDADVIHRSVAVSDSASNIDSVDIGFELDRISDWIKCNNYKCPALQLPDGMLKYASNISTGLESRGVTKPSILGDTSYASCCIDTVTAAHMQCDCLIHFGEACLSQPPSNFPVSYVLPKEKIDLERFREEVSTYFGGLEKSPDSVVLLYQCAFQHISDQLVSIISEISSTKVMDVFDCKLVFPEGDFDQNRRLGRQNPPESEGTRLIIFVGYECSPLLTLWLMAEKDVRQEKSVYRFSPESGRLIKFDVPVNKLLMKRLFLIEKVKDAKTIGIVAAGIGLDKHLLMIERVRKLCQINEKKHYTFSVGKLNVAKLSNFATEIDVFVLLSCPMGVLLDTSEYFKPVVSAFELEVALNPEKSWFAEGNWAAEFEKLLIGKDICSMSKPVESTDMSLISGKVRIMNEEKIVESGALTQYESGMSLFGRAGWQPTLSYPHSRKRNVSSTIYFND